MPLIVLLATLCLLLLGCSNSASVTRNGSQTSKADFANEASETLTNQTTSNDAASTNPSSKVSETNPNNTLPKSASLPREYAAFSASDVLAKVFDDYDLSTGRIKSTLNADKKSALARIAEAKTWNVQAQKNLVVLIELATRDDQFDEGGMCGGCAAYSLLAVLKNDNGALRLIAKQQTPPFADAEADARNDDAPEAIFYSGHDDLRLDLAPYKLTSDETLIGIRKEHIWISAMDWSTTLMLYRIEGQSLKQVFEDTVITREYPKGLDGKEVIKTVATVTPTPSKSAFYDYTIDKAVMRCKDANEDWDCDAKHDRVEQVKANKEIWRFDGKTFSKANS